MRRILLLSCLLACGGSTEPKRHEGFVEVQNLSARQINAVNLKPCTSASWSANQLTTPLNAGVVVTISVEPPGCYDVRALSGTVTWSWSAVHVVAGQTVSVSATN